MPAEHSREFAVTPPGKGARVFLLATALGLPLLAAGLVLGTLPRLPAGADLAGLAVTATVLLLVAALLVIAAERRRVSLEKGLLVIRATFYTQRIPRGRLRLAQARVVDLREHTELAPALKTNAFALPGYYAGHFRAGLVGEARSRRLFCLVTDRSRVLAIPEDDGRTLLLSLERPQALLDALVG